MALDLFLGVKIIQSPHAVRIVEDWSGVRSPGRAARRRRQGHRQNIVMREMPLALQMPNGEIICHPTIYLQLVTATKAEEMRRDHDHLTLSLMYGLAGAAFRRSADRDHG